jgi:hypothetical protein
MLNDLDKIILINKKINDISNHNANIEVAISNINPEGQDYNEKIDGYNKLIKDNMDAIMALEVELSVLTA